MAQITASHLGRWMAQIGFVVMRKPPAQLPPSNAAAYAERAREKAEQERGGE